MKKLSLLLTAIAIMVGCASQYPDLDNGLYADIETSKLLLLTLFLLQKEKTNL